MRRPLCCGFLAAITAVVVTSVTGEYVDDAIDAIVIEAYNGPPLRGHRQLWPLQYQEFNPFARLPDVDEGAEESTIPLKQACITKSGVYGRCTTVNQCYPERKIFKIPAADTWVMGLLNTCSINTRKGRQVFGICCSRGVAQPPSNNTTDEKEVGSDVVNSNEVEEDVTTRAKCQLSDNDKGRVAQTACHSSYSFSTRIVNGIQPPPHKYKFMAALLSTRHGDPRQFCGGSLIDSCHVLTAAHCIDGYSRYDVANLVVYLGAHNIKTNEQVRTAHKVLRLIKHKGFDQGTLYNDVAILTLANCDATQSDYAKPICLPSNDVSFVGNTVTVAGWGALSSGGSQPAELQSVDVNVWENGQCSSSYGNQAPGGIIDSMICAASPGKDSCSGDSGGPLFTCDSSDDPKCIQMGIVSWGIGCAHEKYPGVYTRVTKMKEWIQRIQNCY